MYLAEREAQPDGFSSIPAAMWWGMVTLTTVGYGDLFPVTPLGRGFGAVVALLGIGLFALAGGHSGIGLRGGTGSAAGRRTRGSDLPALR